MPKPLRHILMTVDTVGGVWTYALELTRALQEHGVAVTLATMGAPLHRAQREAVRSLERVQVFESRYKLEWMEEPWQDVEAAGAWLLDLEARLHPDLIHLNGYVHGALPWQAPTLVVGHSCVFSWFDAVWGTPPPATWARYRREVTRGLRRAGRVTAPTVTMLAALKRYYGPFEAAPAIYNGRRAADFPPDVKEPFVLTAGRLWDEAKNVAALAQVAPSLPWPICVAGEEAHPAGGEVHFDGLRRLGRLSEGALSRWMGRAAVYALPARYEPFGLTALEAALAGCALVLGDIPSLREVWAGAALFVPPDDPEALRAALSTGMEDVLLREDLAHRARRHALRYTPERMVRQYLALYEALLQEQAAAGAATARTSSTKV